MWYKLKFVPTEEEKNRADCGSGSREGKLKLR